MTFIRTLHKEGYGRQEKAGDKEPDLKFPLDTIAEALAGGEGRSAGGEGSRPTAEKDFATVVMKDPTAHLRGEQAQGADRDWTILHEKHARALLQKSISSTRKCVVCFITRMML